MSVRGNNGRLGFTISDSYTSNQQRREAMKRGATRKTIARAIDYIMLLAITLISLAVIWLVAINTLPLLGGIAVLVALAIIFRCVCNSFSKH